MSIVACSSAFTVFADVFQSGHHEGYISFLTNDPSSGELVQSFKIDDDVLSASEAINSLVSDGDDNIYIVRDPANAWAQIFLNSDIEYRHFYFGGTPKLEETSDQQNQRYLSAQ